MTFLILVFCRKHLDLPMSPSVRRPSGLARFSFLNANTNRFGFTGIAIWAMCCGETIRHILSILMIHALARRYKICGCCSRETDPPSCHNCAPLWKATMTSEPSIRQNSDSSNRCGHYGSCTNPHGSLDAGWNRLFKGHFPSLNQSGIGRTTFWRSGSNVVR